MARIKQRRSKPRSRPAARSGPMPEAIDRSMERVHRAWDGAVEAGLMAEGAETKYHVLADGQVLSVALGTDGQTLANGHELTPEFAEQLRRALPGLAFMVTFYEDNQKRGLGLAGAPKDGPTLIRQS